MNWFIGLLSLAVLLAGFLLTALVRLVLLQRRAGSTRRQVEALYMETARLAARLSLALGSDAAIQKAVVVFLSARTKAEQDTAAVQLLSLPTDHAPRDWQDAWVANTERISFTKRFEANQREAYNRLAAQMPWHIAVTLFRLQTQI